MSSQRTSLHPQAAIRQDRLKRGINLSHWFSQVYVPAGYTPAHFDSYMTQADIRLIRTMGFDHVRFPIAPEPILRAGPLGQLSREYMARIDQAVRVMLDQGLAVILDVHPETPFKKKLARDDGQVEVFVRFWELLAAHFSGFDAEALFFEVMNEPEFQNPVRWNQVQNRAAAAIRAAAPKHTIIISGDEWSQLPMLEFLEPPPDRNVIANFHLYDPIIFTHQGAGWSPSWVLSCKGMTYPPEPAFIGNFLKTVASEEAVREIETYARLNWNVERYAEMVGRAATWGEEHGLATTCNEFGVYKVFAPRSSRLAWLRDIRGVLEKYRVGWTMWDYAGDFAVVRTADGRREPDTELLASLGLNFRG